MYKNQKCKICHSLSYGSICSSNKCKSWDKYKALTKNIKIKVPELGSYENPIRFTCPRCKEDVDLAFVIYCHECNMFYVYEFTIDKYYYCRVRNFEYIATYTENNDQKTLSFISPYGVTLVENKFQI